ncbi:MAG TPA: anhydro-N-acetylmuramic acid kinase [Methylophilus sp.]
MSASSLYIGIMSGTSLDGIDVSLVSTEHQHFQVVANYFLAYPSALKTDLLTLHEPSENELERTQLMANALAKLYAQAVLALLAQENLSAKAIHAIGCHGQTIRHRPHFSDGIGFTLQIGNAALLAELTGITVVADFRSRDIAAGGQGAPLVPAFHQAVFGSAQHNRVIANIGGIANITYLAASGEVLGFDSGPGNMLLDSWTKQHTGLDYDANGAWAATGQVSAALLAKMLSDPYFALAPPKSTGRDLFNDAWLTHQLANFTLTPQEVARTLVALTAHSLQQAIIQHCSNVDQVYLCGGGAHNALLVQDLSQLLGDHIKVANTDALGVGVDWVEAAAFAWLAKQTMAQLPSNLPAVTGAKGPRILGAIYPA